MIQIGKTPIKLAEREGFEPSVPVTQYARLATSFGIATNRTLARPLEIRQDLEKSESLDQ
jgi:hypothetical protein